LRVARSATGPGNPYWKRPAGSTGGIISLPEMGIAPGTGAGRDVVEVADIDVEVLTALICDSERVLVVAYVMLAAVAALMAATIAIVVFDMVKVGLGEVGIYCGEKEGVMRSQ
jgi:hypothetical protein